MEKNKTLVIVESPTKAKTINKYLGKNYVVKSSMGHLIDLPKSRLAVDVENGFEPDYITIRGRGRILNELRREAHRSSRVLLAADSDREGEAISYHIKNALEQSNPRSEIKRIIFHEITKNAIEEAIKNPRDIDMALVEAQKARRVLDRLVGYNLSPLLWEKIKKGLSAGRVQSVALKVICEREDEIEAFVPEEYWTIEADFKKGKKKFSAKLISFGGEKAEIHSEEEAERILQHVRGRDFVVVEVEEKERRRKPTAPFTTSKLQQAAGSRLGFPARKTMMVAQQLYEGIAVDEGPVGLITYMRTDSTRIAEVAQREAIKYISEHFSKAYLPPKPNVYVNREGAQDAHEAIRPTSVYRTPERLRSYLTRDQLRLYTLIWEQFIASQMNGAVFKQVRVDIQAGEAVFRANGQEVIFDGFLRVLGMEEDEGERVLPELKKGEVLVPEKIEKEVHFTEPPARYTDATLVKFLEESGIGRPSTYAPIISTLIARYYVEREKRQLKPTFLGRLVNDLMVKSFPELLDINFTSNMESRLDEIAEGKLHWVQLLREFYWPFIELVESAQKRLESYRGITDEETEYVCEKCGRNMVKRLGKYGYFLACPGFPECRNAKPLPYGKCPKDGCDGLVVERKTKRKRSFYGCSRYPECDFMTWDKPASTVCPRCGSITAEKDFDGKRYLICLRESCGYRESLEDEKPEKVLVRT
jgi:DNA topoisomerase-1